MKLKTTLFALLLISLIVGDADAGWKFWKKKKDKDETTTTTASPIISNPEPVKVTPAPTAKPSTKASPNTNAALASAADPGLAIGIGSTGINVRNNAQPRKPNPGTEVGLDITGPKPNKPGTGGTAGQGYRDWAADLTGAGDSGRSAPKLPNQGPALTSGGQQQPSSGGKPSAPLPGSPTSQQQPSPASKPGTPTSTIPGQSVAGKQQPPVPGPRPGSPPGHSTPGLPAQTPKPAVTAVTPGPQRTPSNDGKPQVSTLHFGSLTPGSKPGSPTSLSSNAGSTGQSSSGSAGSPTGGKSWADVAAGGSRPGSPTPAPRPGSAQGGSVTFGGGTGQRMQPGQPSPVGSPGQMKPPQSPVGSYGQPGQTRPAQIPVQPYGQSGHIGSQQPGQTGLSTGSAVAIGAIGGAAGAVAATKVFSSNPTYSKGNTVTDEDLQKLSEALFIKDVNNANKYITVNLQKQTTSSSPTDEAPEPLLSVKPEALQIPTIQRVIALYDNYQLDTRTNEYISPAQRQEESVLIDTFLSTNVMSAAMRFLADKGLVRKDYYEYKDLLRRIWFNLFSRGEGKIGSAGFEHVFLTELKLGTEVSGLHNWIYFNAEEVKNRADYLGYTKKIDLGDKASIVKLHIKYNGIDKPTTTIFIGTSPELEMALYTVCFLTRQDTSCPVSLGGTQFNIVTHKFKYRGKDLIGSAYPDI